LTTTTTTSTALSTLLRRVAERTRAYDFTVWFWGDAIAVDGLLEAASLIDDDASRRHCDRYLDQWTHQPLGWADHLAPGAALLNLYERTHEVRYLERAHALAEWLTEVAPQTPTGQPMYRPDLPPYRHTVWVDTIYHEPIFFTRLAQLTGEDKWQAKAIEIWRSHADVLRPFGSPILGHSHDTGARLIRGHGWGRGNGWALLGMVDCLAELPEDVPGRTEALAETRELARTLVGLQDGTGFWRTLLEDREAYTEASTAAFFGAAFTKGVRTGILDGGLELLDAADRAWEAMLSRIDDDGSFWGVSACTYASVHPDDDIQMYKTLPTEVNVWGQGSALRFIAERIRSAV
jgi:unsaturated rhamnogalacturonyl hydrolase